MTQPTTSTEPKSVRDLRTEEQRRESRMRGARRGKASQALDRWLASEEEEP